MADLLVTDVTLTKVRVHRVGMLKEAIYLVAFGNAAKTYPALGVPMPALASFGGLEAVSFFNLVPVTVDGYMHVFDPVNHTVRKFQSGAFVGIAALYSFSFADAKGSTSLAGTEAAADQASGPVNPAFIGAEETFTAMAGTKVIDFQPDVPRNVIIVVHNDSGGALNLYEGNTTYTITGLFRGAAQVETLVWTSTAGNKAVADTKFRYLAGVKPFDKITSITYTNGAAGGLKCSVAPGSKIGLPVTPVNNAEADLLKAMLTGLDYVITGKYNTTNKTFLVGTTGNSWVMLLEYNIAGGSAAAALTEVPGSHAPAATVLLLKLQGK
jgi:hypothetical protein